MLDHLRQVIDYTLTNEYEVVVDSFLDGSIQTKEDADNFVYFNAVYVARAVGWKRFGYTFEEFKANIEQGEY